jgi:hydroxyacylglutathione hydrolase
MDVTVLTTPGLGDNSYVIAHEGIGIVVDPQRDIERFEAVLDDVGVEPRFVLETHLHNDYVSGGLGLARKTGAEIVLPAGSGTAFPYVPAFHHEDIDAGPLSIRPIHTPGHTPEHVSYAVLVDGEPVAVFSGGSLLVGAVGRSDLLGIDRAASLVRLQYQSVQRIIEYPDETALYPTHGAGSFCTATFAGTTTSTIGAEKQTSPVLALPDVDAFAEAQMSGLVPYPTYYRHMGPANVAGPALLEPSAISILSADEMAEAIAEGHTVVDARSKLAFAEGHVPGTWGIELGTDFATWTGWLVPFNAPLVLVLDDADEIEEARTALGRIGFEDIRGVKIGLDDWEGEGRELVSHGTATARQFLALEGDRQVLDVRAPDECALDHLDGSLECYLPDLVEGIPAELSKDEPVYVGCTTGHRASTAAGILADAGYQPVVLTGASLLGVIMLSEGAFA